MGIFLNKSKRMLDNQDDDKEAAECLWRWR
jgi:hypothetical protein